MIFSILRSIQGKRAAARNYRILSALDDGVLCDIGLDRRTLRTFCDNGCSHRAATGGKAGSALGAMRPGLLTAALR